MYLIWFFFFFKQKTAYEMRISDWSSDVCSSDLRIAERHSRYIESLNHADRSRAGGTRRGVPTIGTQCIELKGRRRVCPWHYACNTCHFGAPWRSEEHTSELQSLMRISYAVFCLNKTSIRNANYHTFLTTANELTEAMANRYRT